MVHTGLLARLALICAIGCLAGACGRRAPPASTVTFNKDIAPILHTQCAACHRPGGDAPFSLLTYADAVARADAIGEQTMNRHMPPWLPEPGEHRILGERRLREDQVAAIQRWVQNGAAEGNPADLRSPPVFTDGWQLGRPDVVLAPAHPYVVKPGTEDVYRNLVLRTSLQTGVFVRAVEFRTGGAPIHHAVIRVDRTSTSRRRDGEDGAPGFDGMAWNIQDPDGQFLGWAPGRGPIVSPDGMSWRLDRGADLVVELHVIGSKTAATLQPTVGLFFSVVPPAQVPVTVRMGSKNIDIPAGQKDYVVTDTYELPVPVTLLSVYPHAHYLGKEMRATATLPNGTVTSLLHIKQWNFHWQQDYRYAAPISLPRGTTLTMRYTFDNSTENHHNPRHPPVRVQAGPLSTDEMAELGLQVMPQSRDDAVLLLQSFERREKLANLALGEARVRDAPNVAENRAFLGGSYVEVERFVDAVPHLEAAIRLGDTSSGTENYLGVALKGQGRLADAAVHFRRAATLAPRDEVMHFNLGTALAGLSRFADAAAAFERSIAVNPEYPDAHVNFGVLLLSRGRARDAVPHFQRAAELKPDSAAMHSNLGGALASAGRFAEGMQHVRRALQLDPTYGPALDNLSRLQKMGIR